MQSINDDMDELYRKAAKNYPLKTDGANWDKVLQQMQETPPLVERGVKKGRFLWLLLLLPMFFICNRYPGVDFTRDKGVGENTAPEKRAEKDELTKSTVERNALVKEKKGENNKILTGDDNTTASKRDGSGDFKMLRSAHQTQYHSAKTKWHKTNRTSSETYSNQTAVVTKKERRLEPNLGEKGETEIDSEDPQGVAQTTEDVQNETNSPTDSARGTKNIAQKSIDSLPQQPTIAPEKKQQKKEAKFYYGFIAGADASTVKMQKVEGLGYNFGVIAGYKIKERISIEAGFIWNNKKYYSKGKYFDAKSMNWPMHTELVRIDGYCNMYEIPINIRYAWKAKGSTQFFAMVGTSSYLMNKESYHYVVQRYGLPYSGSKTYNHSTKDWFSVINLGVGYQKNLGKIGDLRIEPYLKIPISGLGIGSLPITSTGINFGLTRPLR